MLTHAESRLVARRLVVTSRASCPPPSHVPKVRNSKVARWSASGKLAVGGPDQVHSFASRLNLKIRTNDQLSLDELQKDCPGRLFHPRYHLKQQIYN